LFLLTYRRSLYSLQRFLPSFFYLHFSFARPIDLLLRDIGGLPAIFPLILSFYIPKTMWRRQSNRPVLLDFTLNRFFRRPVAKPPILPHSPAAKTDDCGRRLYNNGLLPFSDGLPFQRTRQPIAHS
jgi:hypothetical protein